MSEQVSKHDLQPMPTGDGREVTPEVQRFLREVRNLWLVRHVQSFEQARYLVLSAMAYVVKQRDGIKDTNLAIDKCGEVIAAQCAAGLKKYGTVLKTDNGRDAMLDSLQEMADTLQYLTQKIMEQEEKEKCIST